MKVANRWNLRTAGVVLLTLCCMSMKGQTTEVHSGADQGPFHHPFSVGVGLISPAFQRDKHITTPRSTHPDTWRNAYVNAGRFPVGALVGVLYNAKAPFSLGMDASFSSYDITEDTRSPFMADARMIESRLAAKGLWRPRLLRLCPAVQGVIGAVAQGEWQTMKGSYTFFSYEETAFTTHLKTNVGMYYGKERLWVGVEAEFSLLSGTRGDWRRTEYHTAFEFTGNYSHRSSTPELIENNFFLSAISFRVLFNISSRR